MRSHLGRWEAEGDVTGMGVSGTSALPQTSSLFGRYGRPPGSVAVEVADPIDVVESVSRSSGKRVSGSRLEGYFRLPSVRHPLIVTTANRAIIHHRRADARDLNRILAPDPSGARS
jgi:hypothetical protein